MSNGHAAGTSDETLKELLAGLNDSDLKQMAKRLSKSGEDMRLALADLQAEQEALSKEKTEINDTIALMMAELSKLNIRAENLTEPQLDEGPVEFVGRMWEKMRPRDTAVTLNANVGELRMPSIGDQSPVQAATERLREQMSEQFSTLSETIEQARGGMIPTPQGGVTPEDLGRQVSEGGQKLGKKVADQFSMLYSSFNEVANNVAQASEEFFNDEQASSSAPSVGSLFSYLTSPSHHQELGPDSAGPGQDDGPPQPSAKPFQRDEPMQKEEAPSSSSSSGGSSGSRAGLHHSGGSRAQGFNLRTIDEVQDTSSTSQGYASAQHSVEAEPQQTVAVANGSHHADAESEATVANGSSSEPSPEATVANGPSSEPSPVPEARSDPNSTLLVQVQLTLGDGSVETVEVRAADRCKEVAARFIQDHSLKDNLEAPLANFLAQAEKNADTFPVKLEADIDEIRRQYNAKN